MAREQFNPLIQSTVKETLSETLREAEEQTFQYLRDRRQFCLDFYNNEVLLEDGGLDSYLKNFFGYQSADQKWHYPRHLLLEHLPLTEQLIDLKARNYKEQPTRTVGESEAEKYGELLRLSGWHSSVKAIEAYQQLLSDVAVGVFLKPDTKTLQFVLIPDYYPIFDEAHDPLGIDPVAIIYPTALRDDDGSIIYAYYDAQQYVTMTADGAAKTTQPNSYGTFNFFFPHRKKPVSSHFSTPRVTLAMANQNIDVSLTALNQLLHYNGYKKMVITGRVDKDKDVSAEVDFAMGERQVLLLQPGIEGETPPEAKMLDMQADFTQHTDAIKFKFEAAANTLNMAFQWKIEGGPQSGKSLEIQNARDTEDRETIRETLTEFIEQPLFRIVSDLSAKFNLGIEKGELSVDFIDPEPTVSTVDEIAWEKHKLETNQVSVIDLMMNDDPDLTEEEALAQYKRNLDIKKLAAEASVPAPAPPGKENAPSDEKGTPKEIPAQ